MPVSRQFASEQIMRLSGLRDFPPTVPARKELIAALGTVAHNEAHAVELIDAIVRGREFTPRRRISTSSWAAKPQQHAIRRPSTATRSTSSSAKAGSTQSLSHT
jgi:hypothetical protein